MKYCPGVHQRNIKKPADKFKLRHKEKSHKFQSIHIHPQSNKEREETDRIEK